MSTVIAPDCKPAPSTPDVVTRSPVPTTPCNAPPLTVVPLMTTSTKTSTTVYTVTKCPETVPNCPIGKETTEMRVYTTVCPVSDGGKMYPTGKDGNDEKPPYNSNGMPTPGPSSTYVVPVAGARSNMVVGSVGGLLALAAAAVVLV